MLFLFFFQTKKNSNILEKKAIFFYNLFIFERARVYVG